MLRRWLGRPHTQDTSPVSPEKEIPSSEVTTEDPLAAAIGPSRQIYSVSRSVVLPRVALRNSLGTPAGASIQPGAHPPGPPGAGGILGCGVGVGVNPLFAQPPPPALLSHLHEKKQPNNSKTPSSGYESQSSNNDPTCFDAVALLEENGNFVKQILVAVKNGNKSRRSVGSLGSSATGTLTLTTIPEGKVDFCIPRPVWPPRGDSSKKSSENLYDSLLDESVLLYTSLSYVPEENNADPEGKELYSANEMLKELSDTINAAVDGKMSMSPEQVLKCLSDRLSCNLKVIQRNTEEDMRKLSMNLSNNEHLNTVIRAFSNSSSSGNSSQSDKCSGLDNEDIYQVPSGCSSSGFTSGSSAASRNRLPVFIHEDLSSVPNGMRNALIYGTLCRNGRSSRTNSASSPSSGGGTNSANERLLNRSSSDNDDERALVQPVKKQQKSRGLLIAAPDAKPSVWEIYYGAGVVEGDVRMKRKSTDAAYFPAGRPEADFTLDVPRSEMLTRRMRAAKKWRFRCRIFTSFLGLAFFLLSLMAVSLMLTRGKRMFGSMV